MLTALLLIIILINVIIFYRPEEKYHIYNYRYFVKKYREKSVKNENKVGQR